MNDARRSVLVCVLMVLAAVQATMQVGCVGYTIRPPAAVAEPERVYIVDYGDTSRLWLPEDAGGYTEWGYGDWRWYANDKQSLLYGSIVFIWPTPGTLGKHERDSGPWNTSGELLPDLVGYAQLIHEFDAEDEAMLELRTALHERFDSQSDTLIHNERRKMSFVKDASGYWFWNQSSTEMVSWARDLGCDASGFSLRSNFRLKEPGMTTVVEAKK